MLVHWIWLATRDGVSDRVKRELLEHFADAEDVFYADEAALSFMEEMSQQAASALLDKNLDNAWSVLEDCKRLGIQILTYCDAAYPKRLKYISDPPVVLYYKGRLPDFDAQPFISIVGTRKASGYGMMAARQMGHEIGCCGGAVVSGMAEGVDVESLRGALASGTAVVSVLGCGVDVVYPACNRSLYADLNRYGCLISEFVPGTKPYGWNFPKRNRIISGICHGVLVIEAPIRSGSLITAERALEQGRDVFVVPGNINSKLCQGSNAMLRQGAVAVTCGWDVLSEYEALFPGKLHPSKQPLPGVDCETEVTQVAQPVTVPKQDGRISDKKDIDKAPKQTYIDVEKCLPALNEQEQAVIKELMQGEKLTDDVIASTGIAAGQMLSLLTVLEIKGLITRLPGNRIALK